MADVRDGRAPLGPNKVAARAIDARDTRLSIGKAGPSGCWQLSKWIKTLKTGVITACEFAATDFARCSANVVGGFVNRLTKRAPKTNHPPRDSMLPCDNRGPAGLLSRT